MDRYQRRRFAGAKKSLAHCAARLTREGILALPETDTAMTLEGIIRRLNGQPDISAAELAAEMEPGCEDESPALRDLLAIWREALPYRPADHSASTDLQAALLWAIKLVDNDPRADPIVMVGNRTAMSASTLCALLWRCTDIVPAADWQEIIESLELEGSSCRGEINDYGGLPIRV
jgi:hypothetical protein